MSATGRPEVAVVGGGLAGIAAALECADLGARVTLLERRARLGGLTWSFEHNGLSVDNGQHVFLRCCSEYLRFLSRIGAESDVEMPARLDIPVVAPGAGPLDAPRVGRLRRNGLPAPLHLAGSLARFPHLPLADRLGLGRAVAALRRLDLADPSLDRRSFGSWLSEHGQSPVAVAAVWDLITVPTVNLPASEASLAMAAKVFKTGLLTERAAADIGWSRVPLGRLHGEHASAALERAGVRLRTSERVLGVEAAPAAGRGAYRVSTPAGPVPADAVVVAVPHDEAGALLPAGSVRAQDRLADLGFSAVVDVHLVFDRRVTSWPLMAGHSSTVQWVFDRTSSSGLAASEPGAQYLAVSVSSADGLLSTRPAELATSVAAELGRLLPAVRGAELLDALVTKERRATFKAVPGSAQLRAPARTSLPALAVAGAWTDTGWPATMEGAVRSGRAAARSCMQDLASPGPGASRPRGAPAGPDEPTETTEEVA